MAWPFASKSRLTSDLLVKSASPSARFAFKLFRQLAAEQEARNVFFSPASVMLCLALLQEGAAGLTRESMAAVLEVAGLEPEALQLAMVELKSVLKIKAPNLSRVPIRSGATVSGYRASNTFLMPKKITTQMSC